MQSKKCPMRKQVQTNKFPPHGEAQTEKFLDCIKEDCAWFDKNNYCCSMCTIAHLLDWYFVEVKEVEK